MLRTNETKSIKCHEACECECRLDAIVCNNQQYWNNDKCGCECKQLVDNCVCDKDFIWNPSNCECECNKACDFSEYLDYKNCKCKKRLVDKLIDECNETIDEEKSTPPENENSYKCNFCTVYIVLFSIFFIINVALVLILFTINTWIVIKKMFLNIMIMFLIHKIINIKWGKSNK